MALRMDGKGEKRMGQDKEKNRLGRKSRTASSKLGYGFLSNAAWHWREQFTREPKAAVSVLLLSFVAISLPLLNARLPKLVLQGLEERWELRRFAAVLLLLVAVLAVANMLQAALKAYMRRMQGPFEDDFNLRLLKKRLRVDYEILESRQFNEDAHAVYDSLYRPHSVVRDGSMIWQQSLTAAGGLLLYGLILLRQSPLVPLLVLVPALLVFLLKRKAMRRDHELRPAADEAARKMRYVEERGWDLRAGKDIRMYDLGGWLLGILKRERKIGETNVRLWENGYFAANLCDAFLCFVRDAGAYLYFILQIVQGSLPVSDFVWYISVVASCQQACSAFLENVELLGRLSFDYSRLRLFLESGEGDIFQGTGAGAERSGKKVGTDSASSSRGKEAVGIELEHVSFTYPGSRVPTLKDLNLAIRPGEKIALVGLNGAGKSTLVKLLCGLYRPTSGTIRVGGRPLSSFGREEYFSMIAAVFQDVKLLPLTIAQNVASDNGEDIDRQRVRQCLSLAGLWEMVDGLPQKEDTPLGRGVLDDGIDLSGGERQKVWMARAFYKEAPILILDEPTAALDPIAENEIYTGFHEIIGNKTALFISHRLSACRFSKEILVFENGNVVQRGSHEELADGEDIDRQRVRQCLSLAGLWEMVDGLPQKEDTPLGRGVLDDGIDLSGGERQKVWMARAFYKEAPILILDEPTAALDPIAENEIYTGFHEIIGNKTALFISHRLSACRFSKEILVFENGNVVQRGSHEELAEQEGLYRRMWQAQAQYYQ